MYYYTKVGLLEGRSIIYNQNKVIMCINKTRLPCGSLEDIMLLSFRLDNSELR